MSIADPMVMPAAQATLDALMFELGRTAKGAPLHARVSPGDIVVASLTPPSNAPMSTESLGANECCEGIASVRVSRFFPTDDFPTEDPRSLVSGGPLTYAVELELEVVRCGVQPGENFTPTDAQLTADAQWQLDDAAAMRRVAVHLIAQDSVRNAVIGTYDPGSADGGCLGGKLTLTVQVDCLES